MRIERKGNVARLTPRLETFFVNVLGGEPLDSIQHAEDRKADYRCLRGLLAIELKTLEEDASERLENLTDELRERPDWPMFLGSVPLGPILDQLNDSDETKRRVVDRIGRAIKSHMRKANKQLGAHEGAFPRKSIVKVMVLANEDHEVYDPEMVGYIVRHLLNRQENDRLVYPNIDAVIFLTERHATSVNHQVSFPVLCVEGKPIQEAEWKRDVTELLVRRWAKWSGTPLYEAEPEETRFETIDHIPDRMKRYEQWELDYKRSPYMRDFSNEKLRERFDEIICISSLGFLKDSPAKPDHETMMWSMSSMSHMMLEMGWRGIPVTQFSYGPKRLAAAAKRLSLSRKVVEWFENDLGRDCNL